VDEANLYSVEAALGLEGDGVVLVGVLNTSVVVLDALAILVLDELEGATDAHAIGAGRDGGLNVVVARGVNVVGGDGSSNVSLRVLGNDLGGGLVVLGAGGVHAVVDGDDDTVVDLGELDVVQGLASSVEGELGLTETVVAVSGLNTSDKALAECGS
jgi:hypothetical protein